MNDLASSPRREDDHGRAGPRCGRRSEAPLRPVTVTGTATNSLLRRAQHELHLHGAALLHRVGGLREAHRGGVAGVGIGTAQHADQPGRPVRTVVSVNGSLDVIAGRSVRGVEDLPVGEPAGVLGGASS